MDIKIINPIHYPNWDNLLLMAPDSSFFHSSAWARVLSESYQYTPVYFTVFENNKLAALIPVMDIKSLLTGHRGASLPFTDECEPIITENIQFQDMFEYLRDYGKQNGWKSIELRCGKQLFPDSPTSAAYLGHILDLEHDEAHIFKGFRKGVKSSIHKAIGDGVKVKISDSLEALREFYRLNCLTRKRHGVPPQPYIFFKKIHEHILSKKLGTVVIASFQNEVIAGAVYFHFREKVIYKYAASDKKYQLLRANNLVMWEAIRTYRENGKKTLFFGRTDIENVGLQTFKRGWGTQESLINYYEYNLRNNTFRENSRKSPQFSNRILRKVPVPILNFMGTFLYRHAG
jgi:hypothetical protein